MSDDGYRIETDALGSVSVPRAALWGAQTQRAVQNFPVSGLRLPRRLIRALALIKKAAAGVNQELGTLDPTLASTVILAAAEVADGKHDAQFPVDIFQTGSGTSSNMNANEVIANRAIALLGGAVGTKTPIHPNDHVNLGQSSNDVMPSAVHLAALEGVERDLLPALLHLESVLSSKGRELDRIVTIGRTHLMDAVPIRLGQALSGHAAQLAATAKRVQGACPGLAELALGGTAVGTGIGADPAFAGKVIDQLARETGLPLRQAPNLFEALGARDALVAMSAALRGSAVSLTKVANDLRWLGSGPRAGLGELFLPDLQPGSSIMPGKVNPVIPEMLLMVCAQIIGNDTAIAWAGASGNFQLNVMIPLIAHDILQSIEILGSACRLFADRCVAGLRPNVERCRALVEQSLSLATALNPHIGYDAASALAHEALQTGKTIRQVCLDRNVLSAAELDRILDVRGMTGP